MFEIDKSCPQLNFGRLCLIEIMFSSVETTLFALAFTETEEDLSSHRYRIIASQPPGQLSGSIDTATAISITGAVSAQFARADYSNPMRANVGQYGPIWGCSVVVVVQAVDNLRLHFYPYPPNYENLTGGNHATRQSARQTGKGQ